MAKMAGINAATAMAKALGLEPTQVVGFTLRARVGEVIRLEVELLPEHTQLEDFQAIFRQYDVVEKEEL